MIIYASRSENILDRCIGKDVWFRVETFGRNSCYWIRIVKKEDNGYRCNAVADIIMRRIQNLDKDKRIAYKDTFLNKTTWLRSDGIALDEAQRYKNTLTTDELFKLI